MLIKITLNRANTLSLYNLGILILKIHSKWNYFGPELCNKKLYPVEQTLIYLKNYISEKYEC